MSGFGRWENVTETEHVMQTSDGYHAKVYTDKAGGWSGQIWRVKDKKPTNSHSPYKTEEEARAACEDVIVRLRHFRKEEKDTGQLSLNL